VNGILKHAFFVRLVPQRLLRRPVEVTDEITRHPLSHSSCSCRALSAVFNNASEARHAWGKFVQKHQASLRFYAHARPSVSSSLLVEVGATAPSHGSRPQKTRSRSNARSRGTRTRSPTGRNRIQQSARNIKSETGSTPGGAVTGTSRQVRTASARRKARRAAALGAAIGGAIAITAARVAKAAKKKAAKAKTDPNDMGGPILDGGPAIAGLSDVTATGSDDTGFGLPLPGERGLLQHSLGNVNCGNGRVKCT